MPPKKREKDPASPKDQVIIHNKGDQELFLQAYEKPTQIYRYLRFRNSESPIFLNRTLSYMKDRMSRSHKSRQGFKVDSILEKVLARNVAADSPKTGYMNITFLGFYDKRCDASKEPVKVETKLLKICHKKRKYASTPVMTVTVGSSCVPINPSEEFPPSKAPVVSIGTDMLNSPDDSQGKSYHLLLRAHPLVAAFTGSSANTDQTTGEPLQKRRKLSTNREEDKVYGTDLVIYDKAHRLLLGDGDYELLMEEIIPSRRSTSRAPSWENIGDISEQFSLQSLRECTMNPMLEADVRCRKRLSTVSSDKTTVSQDCNSFELFSNGPRLKFRLEWTTDARTPFVDRPRSVPSHDDEMLDSNSNKENRPERTVRSATKVNSTQQAQVVQTSSQNGVKKPELVYQFHYSNNSLLPTEACQDLHCPWCSLDCGTLLALLKHLKLCHARFTFTYSPVPNGARIDVAINESYDGSYTGSPHDVIQQPGGQAFSRDGPQMRANVTQILVCHPKRTKPSLTEFMELEEERDLLRSFITGHNRLYHHTVTCLPVHPKEMDADSEDEHDPKWLQAKTMMMIDEFTDVNEGEKELMKMWNLHIMKHGFVGDCQIPLACKMFLDAKGDELIAKNLYRNFVLHMCSLFDFGLVSPVTLYLTVDRLHKMMKEKEIEEIQKSWQIQHEHWLSGRNNRSQSNSSIQTGTPGRRRQEQRKSSGGSASASSNGNASSSTSNGTPNGNQGADHDPAKRKNSQISDKSPGNAARSKRSWKGVRFCVAVS